MVDSKYTGNIGNWHWVKKEDSRSSTKVYKWPVEVKLQSVKKFKHVWSFLITEMDGGFVLITYFDVKLLKEFILYQSRN